MTRYYTLVLLAGISLMLLSCDSDTDAVEPMEGFTRIYDDPAFTSEYDPLDLLPTQDGGYLMLATTSLWNPYVVKVDEEGLVEWHSAADEAFVSPSAKLLTVADSIYLLCMNEVTLAAEVMQVNLADRSITRTKTLEGVQYPLAISQTPDGSMLVLGYNRENQSSTLHKIDVSFAPVWNAEYAIEEDIEETIIDHLARTGTRLPFFTGTTADGSAYYFNGFSDYTLALSFVSPSSGEPMGTLNGFRQDGYVSAAQHLDGSRFALARQTFGVNALLPTTEVNAQGIGSSSELTANDFPEIASDARLIIKTTELQGREVVVYGTHTKRQQLVFYFYDQASGALLGTQYLGMTNPYQLGNFVFQEDGSLLVVAETFLVGRFSRLCLFKLSPQEVDQILN